MVLKVYGFARATCTQRVLVVLKEKNVPYELIHVDFFANEHRSPAYLAKQPFGKFPYIDDDGFILFESRAICRYIAAKYRDNGTPLVPDSKDLKTTALYEQACSVEQNNFEPFATGIVAETFVKSLFGWEKDEKAIQDFVTKLADKLEGYEAILSKQKYLSGDSLTLADLAHLPTGTVVASYGIHVLEDEAKRPNVARWWKDISSRATWQAVLEAAKA